MNGIYYKLPYFQFCPFPLHTLPFWFQILVLRSYFQMHSLCSSYKVKDYISISHNTIVKLHILIFDFETTEVFEVNNNPNF